MIINNTRARTALTCWEKAFRHYHQNLTAKTKSLDLAAGAALHAGIAEGFSGRWDGAREVAVRKLREETEGMIWLPGEETEIEDYDRLLEVMLEKFKAAYDEEPMQIIQPECEFDVELPGPKHHCVWIHHFSHRRLQVGPPSWQDILAGNVVRCDCDNCLVRHRVVGKTDAVVNWKGAMWLQDHKTTSIEGEQFWRQFLIDIQPTIYLYGIWKSLGIMPSGFIINAIFRPSQRQVNSYNAKKRSGFRTGMADYVRYSREAFLRTAEDMVRVERQLIGLCDEWEERIVSGRFPLAQTGSICTMYNRSCDFFELCCGHQYEDSGLPTREADYVDEKLLGKLEVK